MYVTTMLIPVPEANLDAYRAWATRGAALWREYGALDVVEVVGDRVPHGRRTDFWRAVAAEPGEVVVVSWTTWASRAAFEEAEARLHADPRMEPGGDIPFDPARVVLGCFAPLV